MTKKFPKLFGLPITNRCNLECNFCMRKNLIKFKKLDPSEIIMPTQLLKILKKIKGVDYLNFSSGYGEPFLNPYLPKLIKMASDKGFNVIIFTNSTIKNKDNNYENIITNCYKILISFDYANKKKYLSQRKGADYEKVLKNIMELAKIKKYNVVVKYYFVR